jgi:hypothetical protein
MTLYDTTLWRDVKWIPWKLVLVLAGLTQVHARGGDLAGGDADAVAALDTVDFVGVFHDAYTVPHNPGSVNWK